ncbi:MAG: hypothetical protein UV38_C0001G0114 [candidate division TM6 bacterium GW2011_GWE2_42_60]|nr:MAG: hypothetical protein UV38_C0001G0114 [candidate division TM6 bacterium GW2011_GWE2_42_60]HBY05689.1 hypothetical protein [Candidatus Dependentiae bacterium]
MSIKKFLAERAAGRPTKDTEYIFVGEAYPWLFCSQIISIFVKNAGLSRATVIDAGSVEFSEIDRRLGMSFLGAQEFFWLGDLSKLSVAVQKPLLAFLADYEGPHQVGFFINEKNLGKQQKPGREIILCDEPLSAVDANVLWQVVFPEIFLGTKELFPEPFLQQAEKGVSLEQAVLNGLYVYAGGVSGEKAYKAWQHHLIAADHSLFKMAQYFFAKDKKLFLPLWHAVRDEYPSEFWVAYWSEQLWQAHAFVTRALKGDLAPDKKGNRLPFSFMQRDWRRYKPHEFTVAHSMLYGVDCALKNGCGEAGIDLFILRFITGSFEKSRQ